MSFARSIPSKGGVNSTVIRPLPAVSKLPSRPQSKRSSILPATIKEETTDNIQLFSVPNQNDLEEIVNNLSTIVKRSEELLTPPKQEKLTATVRRTASLHSTKIQLDRKKLPNSIVKSSNINSNTSENKYDRRSKLHDSISDQSSEFNESVSSLSRRTSIRPLQNVEKYSGIKCALPIFKSTIPNAFKGLEKHNTPIKDKKSNMSPSYKENQMTPTKSNTRDKSPWRLRFEKFLNREEPTPLSSITESIAFPKTKKSLLDKENRTPSFRLSSQRSSKLNLPS